MKVEQIGTVETVNVDRVYPLDPDGQPTATATTAIVKVGTVCPLYQVGQARFCMFTGKLNLGGIQRQGDGLLIVSSGDAYSDIDVTFPSRAWGPDQFAQFLREPVATEGHTEQRLRIILDKGNEGATEVAFKDPQACPPTMTAADGETVLHRYRVEAVVYAPTREDAQGRIEQANIYLDAAQITDG